MLAENEYAWQTIEKNTTKRINIYRDWHYKGLNGVITKWPQIVNMSSCIYTVPNETSTITIQTLTTDDDGHTSRLVPNDTIRYGIQYMTTDNTRFYKDIADDKLFNNKKYKIMDGQGVKYVYVIDYSFKLSIFPNYKNIRVFSLFLVQTGGVDKGNETSLLVNYTQDL